MWLIVWFVDILILVEWVLRERAGKWVSGSACHWVSESVGRSFCRCFGRSFDRSIFWLGRSFSRYFGILVGRLVNGLSVN